MGTTELMREIHRLPLDKRLLIVQKTLLSVQKAEQQQMKKAVELLKGEYGADSQLTSFTNLDAEAFYESR